MVQVMCDLYRIISTFHSLLMGTLDKAISAEVLRVDIFKPRSLTIDKYPSNHKAIFPSWSLGMFYRVFTFKCLSACSGSFI